MTLYESISDFECGVVLYGVVEAFWLRSLLGGLLFLKLKKLMIELYWFWLEFLRSWFADLLNGLLGSCGDKFSFYLEYVYIFYLY